MKNEYGYRYSFFIIHYSLFIMKRYCQTLELYDDKELIEAYVAEHAHVWEEVSAKWVSRTCRFTLTETACS